MKKKLLSFTAILLVMFFVRVNGDGSPIAHRTVPIDSYFWRRTAPGCCPFCYAAVPLAHRKVELAKHAACHPREMLETDGA